MTGESHVHEAPHPLLVDVNTACALLGVKRTLLFSLMASGQLRSCKVGRLRKITWSDLAAFVEQLRAEASGRDTFPPA